MVSAMAFSANRSRRSSRYQRISFQPACFKSRRRSPRSPNCDRDQSTALFSTTPVSLRVFIDLRHLTHHPIIPLHSGCDPLSPHSAVVKRPSLSPAYPQYALRFTLFHFDLQGKVSSGVAAIRPTNFAENRPRVCARRSAQVQQSLSVEVSFALGERESARNGQRRHSSMRSAPILF